MRKTIKRLGAVLLAMAMAVSVLCTGALAAETSNSITITTTSSGHTYEAYQVFAGSTSATTDDKTSLGITGWGSGVKADDLVTALTTESEKADSILNGKFTNILKKGNAEGGAAITDKASADVAQNVAASIKDFNDNEAKAFAKIVAAHLSETKTSSTETKNSDVTTGYKIDNLETGYYLVKDEDNTIGANKEDAYTNYIMEVVGAVTVKPKSAVPTVKKKIVENKAEKDATTAKVGDVVNFELTGTLPDNYADYTKYQYEFHDTLSKGLTYNDDVKVYVKNGNKEEVEITGYTVTPAKNTATTTPTADTAITVTFADLKIANGKDNPDVTIDKGSKIIVKYSATLNENAVVGEAGNTNTVNLVYSNNPNGTSTGTTKDDKVTVYTFQLNVTKVDGTNNGTRLAGAKFKLYYEKDGTKNYAKVNLSEGDNKDKITGWTATETEGTVLTTDNSGNITVKGLKEGTYYLEEIEAPAGYNKLTAPVKVDIANNPNSIYELKSVEADGKAGTVAQAVGTITIANNKGSTLPSTGGMGTKLFYTIGGILMAGAAIVLVVRKRRSDAE